MKTPQEEAEEIVNQTIFAIDQYYQNYADYRIEMKLEINQKIPLPELIAVARAANKRINSILANDRVVAEREEALAIDALRATRKVEL